MTGATDASDGGHDAVLPASSGTRRIAGLEREQVLVLAILLVGAALRIARFAESRSLWNDEGLIAPNIVDLPVARFFSQPLLHGQAAPVGWLLLERLSVVLLGPAETGLRMVPLLAGLVSLPLFLAVARAVLPGRAALLALAWFAVLELPIHLASDAKQYSSDVPVALGLTLLGLRALDVRSALRISLLAGAGLLAIWFSHPSMFVLAGVGTTLGVVAWVRGEKRCAAGLCLVGAAWIGTFAASYLLISKDVPNSAVMLEFWTKDFAPFPPTSMHDVIWYGEAAFRTAKDLYQSVETEGMPPVGAMFSGLIVVLGAVGAVSLARRDRARFALVGLPLAFTLAASSLGKYPFRGRFLAFLAPLFVLWVAAGLWRLRTRDEPARKSLPFVVATCAVLLSMTAVSAYLKMGPFRGHQESRRAWEYVRDRWQEGDTLLLFPEVQVALDYYWDHCPEVGRPQGDVMRASPGDWPDYDETVRGLAGRTRLWVISSHTSSHLSAANEPALLLALERHGHRVDEHEWVGAKAFLIDLR